LKSQTEILTHFQLTGHKDYCPRVRTILRSNADAFDLSALTGGIIALFKCLCQWLFSFAPGIDQPVQHRNDRLERLGNQWITSLDSMSLIGDDVHESVRGVTLRSWFLWQRNKASSLECSLNRTEIVPAEVKLRASGPPCQNGVTVEIDRQMVLHADKSAAPLIVDGTRLHWRSGCRRRGRRGWHTRSKHKGNKRKENRTRRHSVFPVMRSSAATISAVSAASLGERS